MRLFVILPPLLFFGTAAMPMHPKPTATALSNNARETVVVHVEQEPSFPEATSPSGALLDAIVVDWARELFGYNPMESDTLQTHMHSLNLFTRPSPSLPEPMSRKRGREEYTTPAWTPARPPPYVKRRPSRMVPAPLFPLENDVQSAAATVAHAGVHSPSQSPPVQTVTTSSGDEQRPVAADDGDFLDHMSEIADCLRLSHDTPFWQVIRDAVVALYNRRMALVPRFERITLLSRTITVKLSRDVAVNAELSELGQLMFAALQDLFPHRTMKNVFEMVLQELQCRQSSSMRKVDGL